ncbi:MAG: hypothetical protein AAGH72_10750 [Verrucomicrobiota bacterium]
MKTLLATTMALIFISAISNLTQALPGDPGWCPQEECTATPSCPPVPPYKNCSQVPQNKCEAFKIAQNRSCKTGNYKTCEKKESAQGCQLRPSNTAVDCGNYNCAVICTWDSDQNRCVLDSSSECSDVNCAPECDPAG